MDTLPKGQLDDVRRQMRLGMGRARVAAPSARSIAHERVISTRNARQRLLRLFLKNAGSACGPSCTIAGQAGCSRCMDPHEGTRRRAPARSQEGIVREERRCYRCRPARSVRRDQGRRWATVSPSSPGVWAIQLGTGAVVSRLRPRPRSTSLSGVGSPTSPRVTHYAHVTRLASVHPNRVAARPLAGRPHRR